MGLPSKEETSDSSPNGSDHTLSFCTETTEVWKTETLMFQKRRLNKSAPQRSILREKKGAWDKKNEEWMEVPGSKGRSWSSERCMETNARRCLGQPVSETK